MHRPYRTPSAFPVVSHARQASLESFWKQFAPKDGGMVISDLQKWLVLISFRVVDLLLVAACKNVRAFGFAFYPVGPQTRPDWNTSQAAGCCCTSQPLRPEGREGYLRGCLERLQRSAQEGERELALHVLLRVSWRWWRIDEACDSDGPSSHYAYRKSTWGRTLLTDAGARRTATPNR